MDLLIFVILGIIALAQTPGPDLICQDVVQHRQFMKYYNINSVYQTNRTRAGWQDLTQKKENRIGDTSESNVYSNHVEPPDPVSVSGR